jgi:hypothetical protein
MYVYEDCHGRWIGRITLATILEVTSTFDGLR